MKYTVVTTFNRDGLDTYAQRMIETFEQQWPKSVDLLIYAENCQPSVDRPNTVVRDIFAVSPQLTAFQERHRNNDLAHGRAGPPGVFDERKQFRWDAARFSYKVYAIAHAAATVDSDYLIWLDADTHTHSTVPVEWLATVCPDTALASYLGRGERYHSECGWVGYNLSHPEGKNFIQDFVAMYDQDLIFNEKEWHDSYIWDVVRRRYMERGSFHNLNPDPDTKGLAKHPFINSELGRYMDHVKGKRKEQGHSRAKEVVLHSDHPYWHRVRGMR